jgi:anti-sigma regulatory factor (Ser/Thr protein kinase)
VFEDGEIWFGSGKGITRFYPQDIHDVQIKAIPQITEIQVNDHIPFGKLICQQTGATNITEIQKLKFDFRSNTISLRINSLEYSAPKFNKVRYWMEGMDSDTLETTSGSFIRYPNISPGTHRLVLFAGNSDGLFNPEPRILIIVITPPYYKTWWFYTLMALIAISIIAYIVYLRFSKRLELQNVRLKLYENLHDDVGSRLTAIVLSAEDLERNENLSHPKLKSISQIARSIVGNMRRLVWAIDPENDKINSIVQKINHDKAQILNDSIECTIEVDEHLKNMIVPGEIRYQMSSICNEAFNNISKYARADSVKVKILKEKNQLIFMIEDNGIGFNPAEQSKKVDSGSGYGLANMQRRASRVQGKFSLNSAPGKGTRIEVRFPLS